MTPLPSDHPSWVAFDQHAAATQHKALLVLARKIGGGAVSLAALNDASLDVSGGLPRALFNGASKQASSDRVVFQLAANVGLRAAVMELRRQDLAQRGRTTTNDTDARVRELLKRIHRRQCVTPGDLFTCEELLRELGEPTGRAG